MVERPAEAVGAASATTEPEDGIVTTEEELDASMTATSAVKAAIKRLTEHGHIVLLKSTQGERVCTGKEFQQAWGAAARLAGNPEA